MSAQDGMGFSLPIPPGTAGQCAEYTQAKALMRPKHDQLAEYWARAADNGEHFVCILGCTYVASGLRLSGLSRSARTRGRA
jgi:hypothetical protein